jgi:hypothetical protein
VTAVEIVGLRSWCSGLVFEDNLTVHIQSSGDFRPGTTTIIIVDGFLGFYVLMTGVIRHGVGSGVYHTAASRMI